VLDLADDWVWDFWTVRDGPDHHAFFLKAPRILGDPDLRHHHASVGHAVSTDLVTWTRLPDTLAPQPAPAFDDLACWTGSTVRGPDGRWWLFTSGLSHEDGGRTQRIGAATSTDLLTWTRTDLRLEADPRWYAPAASSHEDLHWRDPYVVADTAGTWHMYVTAKAQPKGAPGNGVVGHATSPDLVTWTVQPPLGGPTGVFDQLEVISLAEVDGRWALLFSCLGPELVGLPPGTGGVWSVPVDGPGADVVLSGAVRLTSEDLYVGRVVSTEDGPRFLAFRNRDEHGTFVGGLIDPHEVGWRADRLGLEVRGLTPRWRPSSLGTASLG
jgi:beta-fructofuranosidase